MSVDPAAATASVPDLSALIPSGATLDRQFWSTLIGVLVGGFITFVTQILNQRHTRKLAETAERKRDLTTAVILVTKLTRMYSTIVNVREELDGARTRAKSAGYLPEDGSMRWELMPPLIGNMTKIEFSDEELMFLIAGLPRSFLPVIEMPDLHNDLVELVGTYAERRIELEGLLSIASTDGLVAETHLTQLEAARLGPRFFALNSLIGPIFERSAACQERGFEVFGLVQSYCRKRFGADMPDLALPPPPEGALASPSKL